MKAQIEIRLKDGRTYLHDYVAPNTTVGRFEDIAIHYTRQMAAQAYRLIVNNVRTPWKTI